MNAKAQIAFVDRLRKSVPVLKEIVRDWPQSTQTFKYPFMSVMVVSSRAQRSLSGPTLLKSVGNTQIYKTATKLNRIDLHFFYQTPDEKAQGIEQIESLFNSDVDQGVEGSFTLRYGPESWEIATLRMTGFELTTDSQGYRQGERRLIFEITGESIETKQTTQDVVSDWQIDAHVSER